jgi:hypothetical protein
MTSPIISAYAIRRAAYIRRTDNCAGIAILSLDEFELGSDFAGGGRIVD